MFQENPNLKAPEFTLPELLSIVREQAVREKKTVLAVVNAMFDKELAQQIRAALQEEEMAQAKEKVATREKIKGLGQELSGFFDRQPTALEKFKRMVKGLFSGLLIADRTRLEFSKMRPVLEIYQFDPNPTMYALWTITGGDWELIKAASNLSDEEIAIQLLEKKHRPSTMEKDLEALFEKLHKYLAEAGVKRQELDPEENRILMEFEIILRQEKNGKDVINPHEIMDKYLKAKGISYKDAPAAIKELYEAAVEKWQRKLAIVPADFRMVYLSAHGDWQNLMVRLGIGVDELAIRLFKAGLEPHVIMEQYKAYKAGKEMQLKEAQVSFGPRAKDEAGMTISPKVEAAYKEALSRESKKGAMVLAQPPAEKSIDGKMPVKKRKKKTPPQPSAYV